jgi:hypothetical protein
VLHDKAGTQQPSATHKPSSRTPTVLDLAFLKLIGAGLTSLGPAYNIPVPPGGIAHGDMFLDRLWRIAPQASRQLVESTTGEIWIGWKSAGLPAGVAERHMMRLPDVMESCRADPDRLVAALAVAHATSKLGQNHFEVQARSIASDILLTCRTSDSLRAAGLNEQLSFFFLETLFASLLKARSIVEEQREALTAFLSERSWEDGSESSFPVLMETVARP